MSSAPTPSSVSFALVLNMVQQATTTWFQSLQLCPLLLILFYAHQVLYNVNNDGSALVNNSLRTEFSVTIYKDAILHTLLSHIGYSTNYYGTALYSFSHPWYQPWKYALIFHYARNFNFILSFILFAHQYSFSYSIEITTSEFCTDASSLCWPHLSSNLVHLIDDETIYTIVLVSKKTTKCSTISNFA